LFLFFVFLDRITLQNIYFPQGVSPVTKISKTHPANCPVNAIGTMAVKNSEQERDFFFLAVGGGGGIWWGLALLCRLPGTFGFE
jgi:hypothetical protein